MIRSMGQVIVAGWLAVILFNSGLAAEKKDDLETKAKKFVELMSQEKWDKAVKDFDDTMKKVLPADKLAETWKAVTGKVGAFKKQKGQRTEKAAPYDIVLVISEFANADLDIKVVFNSDKQISGLFFLPPKKPPVPYIMPGYVRRDSFDERQVTIGSGEWRLPGTLTMPKGSGPFPGVILVHGSGPHDRDETIGPNRPFRDLAWGLASRGIAVLRYEKRTKEYSQKVASQMDHFTIKEEVLDDALAGVSLLRKTPGVASQKIFVVGHSLGGVVVPRIGGLDHEIAGLISLAGTARPLEEVLVDQLSYLLTLADGLSEENKTEMAKMKQQALAMKSLQLTPETPSSTLPLGLTATYWISLRDYQAVEEAKSLKQPLLFLQGERDYQSTMDDFQIWRKALANRKNVTCKSYPRLNHLFMDGQGKSKPSEYEKAGSVAQEVVDDIADWIKRHS